MEADGTRFDACSLIAGRSDAWYGRVSSSSTGSPCLGFGPYGSLRYGPCVGFLSLASSVGLLFVNFGLLPLLGLNPFNKIPVEKKNHITLNAINKQI